jgi:hypothetical protein
VNLDTHFAFAVGPAENDPEIGRSGFQRARERKGGNVLLKTRRKADDVVLIDDVVGARFDELWGEAAATLDL